VELVANFGLAGAPLNVPGGNGKTARILPGGYTMHGQDIIVPWTRHAKADIVITLYDAWVFDPKAMSQVRWVPWLPVDHDPLPPGIKNILEVGAWQPLAYSRFGYQAMKDAGLDPRYVPHGVDTKLFAPKDRSEARAALKWKDANDIEFLAIMVAANKGTPSRKAFPEVLKAWREFVKKHPKSLLYLHTHPGMEMQGLDLSLLLTALDMPDNNVAFADPDWLKMGYPPSFLNNLYNAADVLLSPSYGEGFGLPIVEAQACGCPVIVNDCTSMPELCFAGWKTGNQPWYTPLGSWQFVPEIGDIEDALHEAYKLRDYDKLRRDARQGAEAYDADLVTEQYWKPVLEELAKEVAVAENKAATDPLQMVDLAV